MLLFWTLKESVFDHPPLTLFRIREDGWWVGDFWGWQLVLASCSRLGLAYWGQGLCKSDALLLLPFYRIKLNSGRRDLHLPVIASIKYPSLMPLYIYSVSLETHKASFSDLCDETSLHYLPGTFWRNKRPIEQSFEMNKYEKGGNKRAGSSLEQRALFIWMLYMLYPVFPSGFPGEGEWGREDNRQGTLASSLTSWLPILTGVGPLLTAFLSTPFRTPEHSRLSGFKGDFEFFFSIVGSYRKTLLGSYLLRLIHIGQCTGWRERDVTFLWHVSRQWMSEW